MRNRTLTIAFLTVPLLGACNRSPEPPAAPTAPAAPAAPAAPTAPAAAAAQKAAPPETAPGHFGAPLSDKAAVAASAVLADPAKYDGQELKLTGQVGGVCQKKGCWMTIGGGEPGAPTVRVSFKDYGFFVPVDSMGKQATVEGRFQVKTISQGEAQHYADDARKAGAPKQVVDAPQRTLALVATGVELK